MKPATELIHVADGITRRCRAADDAHLRDDDVRVRERAAGARLQRRALDEVPLLALRQSDRRWRSRAKIAALEGAASALVFSSGQAATTTALLALLAAGDEVVCSGAIYGGTLHLISDLLPKFGIRPRFVSIDELRQPESILSPATKLVWFESPINPTLRCVDIAAVARGVPRARRAPRSSTTPSPARSISSRSRSASTSSCTARRSTSTATAT